mgnify:CR=1 FL=1
MQQHIQEKLFAYKQVVTFVVSLEEHVQMRPVYVLEDVEMHPDYVGSVETRAEIQTGACVRKAAEAAYRSAQPALQCTAVSMQTDSVQPKH